LKICIPTKNRVGKLHTDKLFYPYDIYLFVEPQEVEAYKKEYPGYKIINIEKSNQGIAYVRNFILNYFDENILMLDDDIIKLMKRVNKKLIDCSAKEVIEEMENCLTKGYAQATISFIASNWYYTESYKVNTRTWCLSAINTKLIKENNIIYDSKVNCFEDFDFTAQLLSSGLKNICSYKYAFDCIPMSTNKGGLNDGLRQTKSNASLEIIKDKWPGLITIIDNNKTGLKEPQFKWKYFK